MALTGAAVRLGSATGFGISEASPRGCSAFGDNLYVLGAGRLILMSDLAAGSGEYVSGVLTSESIGGIGGHSDRLYLVGGHGFFRFDAPFRGADGTEDATVSLVGTLGAGSEPLQKGLASDGTALHSVSDGGRENSAIYSINTSDASKTRVGTIAWPAGLTGPRPLGLFYYEGAFYVIERSGANLYRLSDPDPDNSDAMTATRVGNFTQFDVSESIPTGCGVFSGLPYLVGSGNDAIYRFLDDGLTPTPAPPVVTVPSAPTSLSLTATHNTIVATWRAPTNNGGENPTRYDIRIDGGTWVSTNLETTHTFTGLSPETSHTIDVAAVNSAGRGTAARRTRTTLAAPIVVTVPSAPTSLSLTATHNTIVATWAAPTNTGGEAPTRYDIRINNGNWVNAGLDGTHTFRNRTPETDYTIDVVAVNSAGRGATASRTQRTDAAPIVITAPGAPTSLSLRATHNSIVATWGAPTDTGNAVIERYDIRIDGGEWENVSLLTNHTYESLSPETRYTIEVAAVNSAGRGAAARRTRTTPAAPVRVTVPSAPTSLSLRATHNSIVATWGAPADTGNAVIERYDIRIDGGSWIDAGLDGTHTFRNLSQNTAHTIDVAGVNSAGRGATASGTKTTGITVPGAPTSLSVEVKPTTALITWAVATDGVEVEEYEVSYQEGARPGTTWIATGSTGTRFFVRDLKRGTQYTFRVRGRNSAGAGAGSRPVTQNTPIASLHNALFFKECVNALDNGERVSEHGNASNIIRAVADNNYKTFSTVRDYAIDMSRNNQPTRVDAVFIKSKGVTRHSGTPTGGSGTGWTNEALPETVENWEGTHISTTVLGFQHHLLLMDQHFTATSVRVRFEGTNVEIYEIRLLEFLLEIDANGDFTEIAPDYVDRSAVIHPSPGGGIQRSSSLGAERQKWETNYVVKIVPGKTLLESVDEFVYQMGENPNIVHAQEPSRYPARVHPASFLLKRVPTRLRSDDKLSGDAVQFRVGEQ